MQKYYSVVESTAAAAGHVHQGLLLICRNKSELAGH